MKFVYEFFMAGSPWFLRGCDSEGWIVSNIPNNMNINGQRNVALQQIGPGTLKRFWHVPAAKGDMEGLVMFQYKSRALTLFRTPR
jgi:hypothetical protein